MDKTLLTVAVTELIGTLIRSGLEFARTAGLDEAEVNQAFVEASAQFLLDNPDNITFGD